MPVHCGAEPSDIADDLGVSGSEDHRLPREVHTTDRMLRCVLRSPTNHHHHTSAQSLEHSQGQYKGAIGQAAHRGDLDLRLQLE